MKIFIGYDSKTGTVLECAELLKKEFPLHEVTLCDLREEKPDFGGYDFMVIGASIRMGKFSKFTRTLLIERAEEIKRMPHALFLCCGVQEDADDYIKKNFPKELLDSAVIASCFGGELRPERCKGIEKLIIKIARKSMLSNDDIDHPNEFKTMPAILPEKISYFADRIRESF